MKNFLKTFLKNRPAFYVFIRPYEALIFNAKIPLKKPVLDFGCGDGFFAKVAFEKLGKIDVGLDLGEVKLKEAKLENIYKRIVSYKGVKIPFKSESFSTVVSNSVLEHVESLRPSLGEINRVLTPRGKFLCTVMTKQWKEYLFGGMVFGKRYKNWMRRKQKHVNLYDLKDWRKAFKKAGFKVIGVNGYLGKRDTVLIELMHYLSVGSLVSYKLFGRWILFPGFYDLVPLDKLFWSIKEKSVKQSASASLFFELEKV